MLLESILLYVASLCLFNCLQSITIQVKLLSLTPHSLDPTLLYAALLYFFFYQVSLLSSTLFYCALLFITVLCSVSFDFKVCLCLSYFYFSVALLHINVPYSTLHYCTSILLYTTLRYLLLPSFTSFFT